MSTIVETGDVYKHIESSEIKVEVETKRYISVSENIKIFLSLR
jgi:hypothetical protein